MFSFDVGPHVAHRVEGPFTKLTYMIFKIYMYRFHVSLLDSPFEPNVPSHRVHLKGLTLLMNSIMVMSKTFFTKCRIFTIYT